MFKYIYIVFILMISVDVSAQDLVVVKSQFLKMNDTVLVYTPKNYHKDQKYPVLYLLHGHSANYKAWSRLADLQALSTQYGFIVVCPDGLKKSWYLNSPRPDSLQYESFFIKELLPRIQQDYAVDAAKYFITGASMGGFGAMYLFTSYPNLFLSAGSTSGVLNLRHSGFKKTTLAYLLGEYTEENKLFDEYSPIHRLHLIKGLNKSIIFDCGTEDYLYKANNQFRAQCDSLKIKATYITQPGAHTGAYWAKALPQHFKFFYEHSKSN